MASGIIKPMPRGRPPKHDTNEIMEQIIARVADGATLKSVCQESGMPSAPTFRKWLLENTVLSEKWQMAKKFKAHSLFDEAIDIARELKSTPWSKDQGNIVRAKEVAIRTLIDAAEKLNPQEYAPKAGQAAVVPIQIITSLNLGQQGRPMIGQNSDDVYTIDVTPRIEDGRGKP